nr:2861_t:CDS:2 [Entrophospora candida]
MNANDENRDGIIGPKNQHYIFKLSKSKTNLFDDYDDINDINNFDNIVSKFGDNAIETKGQLKIDVEDDDITVTVNGNFFEIVQKNESVKVQIDKEMMTLFFKKKVRGKKRMKLE